MGKSDLDIDPYQETEEDTQEGKYLNFSLEKEDYGIEIRQVREIIGIQKITEVPDMPEYIRGVINLRGKVIPVMDVRTRFRMPSREYDNRTCIIVVQIDGHGAGGGQGQGSGGHRRRADRATAEHQPGQCQPLPAGPGQSGQRGEDPPRCPASD